MVIKFSLLKPSQVDLDVPLKMARLKQWCNDLNKIQLEVDYWFVYIDMEGYEKYQPKTFEALVKSFARFKLTYI